MNWRRGSTASPIRIVKSSSALAASSTVTSSSRRAFGIHGGFPELGRVHLTETLVALDVEALLGDLVDAGSRARGRLSTVVALAVSLEVVGADPQRRDPGEHAARARRKWPLVASEPAEAALRGCGR